MHAVVYTFYLAALPVALLCGLVQLAASRRFPDEPAFRWWAAGDLVGFVGAVLIVLRGQVPWWVSSALANTIIVAAGLLVWGGMRRFGREAVPVKAFAIATVSFFLLFQGLWWLTQDLAMRVLLTSVALCVLNGGVAFDLARSQRAEPLATRAFIATLFALHSLFYLFRSATAVTLEPGDEFLQSGGIQNVALVVGTLKVALWNGAVLLLQRERRQRRQSG